MFLDLFLNYKGIFKLKKRKEMTNIYGYLKKKSKKEVVLLGKAYAYDKGGFVRFAEKNWRSGNEDFVRAVVAAAALLIDRPKLAREDELPKQIYALDQQFDGVDGQESLLSTLVAYFDNGQTQEEYYEKRPEIAVAYKNKVKAYDKILSLREQKEQYKDKEVKPILGRETIELLKQYNRKPVLLSLYRRKTITPEHVYKIVLNGRNIEDLSVTFNGTTVRFISDMGGVASLRDVDTGDVIFKNDLRSRKFTSQLEKYTHIYGYAEAIEIMKRAIHVYAGDDDEKFRDKKVDDKTKRNQTQVKRAIEHLKKSDSDQENY